MTITDISPQKHDPARYSVFVDGQFRVGLSGEDVLYHHLHIGDDIDEETIAHIADHSEFAKARDAAARYLGYRARSEREVRAKLAEKGYGADASERAVQLLIDNGHIDDQAYALAYIQSASNRYGRYRVTRALMERGVSDRDIEAAYAEYIDSDEAEDETETARTALIKRYGEIPTDYDDRRRAYGFLARRGFDADVIGAVLET